MMRRILNFVEPIELVLLFADQSHQAHAVSRRRGVVRDLLGDMLALVALGRDLHIGV